MNEKYGKVIQIFRYFQFSDTLSFLILIGLKNKNVQLKINKYKKLQYNLENKGYFYGPSNSLITSI